MSEGNFPPEPFGKIEEENVTKADYEKAVRNLNRFAEKDLSEIASFDDLAFEMRFVGIGLRAVILSTGEINELPVDPRHTATGIVGAIDRVHELEGVKDGKKILATAKSGKVYVGQSVMEGEREEKAEFETELPSDKAMRVSGDRFEDEMVTFAMDWRGEKSVVYNPALHPENAEVRQGYAKVVQDGVKAVLGIARPPTQVPFTLK